VPVTVVLPVASVEVVDDDEDFEEARDTFDEGRLVSASKVDSGSAKIVDVTNPMSPTAGKARTSGEGSRFTEEL